MFRKFLVVGVLALLVGCTSSGQIPVSNGSSTGIGGNDFKIVRTGLRGEASCMYLLWFIPLSDPAIATKAMDQLVESSGSNGKSIGLVNFALDQNTAIYPFVSQATIRVRADAAEFSK